MERVKRVCSSSLDFISDLPSSLIENILMCLPLADAVRTSILSRKWRYKWVTLPQLVFDTHVSQESPGNLVSAKGKLVMTINQVLLCYKGPIVKFVLFNPDVESCSDIDCWILFLSNNNIQDFTLRIWRGKHHELPSHFYSFLQMRHLKLYSCLFKPPPTFKGFSRLVSLFFHEVVLTNEILGSFISHCPLLKQLRLYNCTSFECLDIDAPSLKFLVLSSACKTIHFKNTPLLAIAVICLSRVAENVEHLVEGRTSNLIKVFGCLPVIENLCVSGYFLKFLAVGNVLQRLPMTLKHMKILKMGDLRFAKMDEISCALCLIRSSPNLQELKIWASRNTSSFMEPVAQFWQGQDFSNWPLNQLQKVTIEQISGVEPELEFIKFLLATSKVLKTMHIEPLKGKVTDGGVKILEELTQSCRASPKVEIIYSDPVLVKELKPYTY